VCIIGIRLYQHLRVGPSLHLLQALSTEPRLICLALRESQKRNRLPENNLTTNIASLSSVVQRKKILRSWLLLNQEIIKLRFGVSSRSRLSDCTKKVRASCIAAKTTCYSNHTICLVRVTHTLGTARRCIVQRCETTQSSRLTRRTSDTLDYVMSD
jgi:hypothetical protein